MLQLSDSTTAQPTGAYANINGLNLYYEIHGKGMPLVLIHGGGSTIETSFGSVLPVLARKYKIIAVELQAHGRTKDIDRPLRFEQDADDVAALLEQLQIKSAAVFGFSNGATTALQMAIRHPQLVTRLVLASLITKRSGVGDWFWSGFPQAHIGMMPQALKDAYLKVSPDPEGLQKMFDRDVQRMIDFKDINDDEVRSVTVPALIVNSEQDVPAPEHAVEIYRLVPQGHILIVPGGHGEWLNAAEAHKDHNPLPALILPMVERFLDTTDSGNK